MRSLGPRYFALWVGQTVSQFGTYIALLTIPLLVLHIQESESTLDFNLSIVQLEDSLRDCQTKPTTRFLQLRGFCTAIESINS